MVIRFATAVGVFNRMPKSSQPRIFYGWWIVAAAMVGMSTAPSQFAFGSLGLFIRPLTEEFGWDRARISLALTAFTVALAFCLPVVGRLADRWGARRVLVPSVVVCGVSLAAIPFVDELWQLWLIFALIGSLGAGANNLPYMMTISAWFDRRRGLAIGLAMAGAGFGFAYVPPLVQFLIDTRGWRAGYWVLAGITLLVAAPLLRAVLRDTPAELGLAADGVDGEAGQTGPGDERGLRLPRALRTIEFWLLWLMFCALSFSLYGLLPHFVPLLTDRGIVPAQAALVSSVIGITVIVARIVIGWLIDRFFAPRVAFLFFLMSAVGIAALALGDSVALAVVAAVLIGLSLGAEIDLLAFLTGRYFGLREFGAIYGVMFAALLVGTSAGPVSFGAVYELRGSYTEILIVCAVLNAAASMIMLVMPRYPEFGDADA